MLAQNDQEREMYEARRKMQLDINTGMRMAILAGEAKGAVKGLQKNIHLCERLLRRPQTPADQLAAMSLDDLTRLANELEEQVLKQR